MVAEYYCDFPTLSLKSGCQYDYCCYDCYCYCYILATFCTLSIIAAIICVLCLPLVQAGVFQGVKGLKGAESMTIPTPT